MVEEQDRETTFSSTDSSKNHLKLSNFHKTTSEHRWRTPGTQKSNPISSKGGRTKYKRQKKKKRKEKKR